MKGPVIARKTASDETFLNERQSEYFLKFDRVRVCRNLYLEFNISLRVYARPSSAARRAFVSSPISKSTHQKSLYAVL